MVVVVFADPASLESLTSYGETSSLALVSASFLVLGLAAVRARTPRSLQFETFVFACVLLVAEVPHILGALGLLDISRFETVGLEVHSLSMLILSAFVAYRIHGFFNRRALPISPERATATVVRKDAQVGGP